MTEKRPTVGRRPAEETRQAAGRPGPDHGVPSLVAQDNPDDSQLGATAPGEKERHTRPE